MSLGIESPAGQLTLAEERRCMEIFCAHHPGLQWFKSESNVALVDAVIVYAQEIVAIIEQKSRKFTLDCLLHKFDNEWLLSADKIEAGIAASRIFCVPFFGFLYLVPDDVLLIRQITDETGAIVAHIEYRDDVPTQRDVNGGKIIRRNGFIDMKGARHCAPVGGIDAAAERGAQCAA